MLVVGIFADIRAIVADQIVEHRPHRLHVHLQRRHQRRPIRQPHAVGQPRLVERILRQRLGLLIADRLQQILQPPQEQVGGAQRPHLLGLQQPQLPTACSVGSSERPCSAGSRPPRISWNTG